jgi:3-deoxy-manno-octulosonate cytidylyltransferase (CMP-KDO synthetase)
VRAVIIIPARYQSSRFEGKPLALIAGVSLIERTWRRCAQALDPIDIYVATDDVRIADHCRGFGAQVRMTPEDCPTGTDRVFAAAEAIPADCYVNVQGDEPLIDPTDITTVIRAWTTDPNRVVNAMCPIENEESFRSAAVPKVCAAPDGRLLYMSRAGLPASKDGSFNGGWRQVCVYAFGLDQLRRFAKHGSRTPLESVEDIEILRFLELGEPVWMVPVSSASIAVDFPHDVAVVEAALAAGRMVSR